MAGDLEQLGPHVLRQYALLADGERGALVGPAGDIAWMCMPNWHSPALFSALLGGRGSYVVRPADPWFVWGGYYEPGTLIWRSRWVSGDSVIECREALALPATADRARVLRRIVAVRGSAWVSVLLDSRAEFGKYPAHWWRVGEGCVAGAANGLRLRCSGTDADPAMLVPGQDGALRMDVQLEAGEHHDLMLEIAAGDVDTEPLPATVAWQQTEAAWRDAVPGCADTIAPREASHAHAVLRGLTASTGGTVAAATTSLPERAAEGRNYDYRFVWIRDQCMIGQGIAAHRPHPLLSGALDFVADRLSTDGQRMAAAYTVDGATVPDEHPLPVPGYPGGHACAGNHVRHQFQLDAFAEALLLFAAAGRRGVLEARHGKAVQVAAETIALRWQEPDAGIWELSPAWWTHSQLACVAGLRAAARHAAPDAATAASWSELAATILDTTSRRALHPSGRWQRSPRDRRVDAALLLPALRGAVDAAHPASVATLRAVREQLGQEGYVYRFRHDDRPLGDAEGAFLLCGHLMALAEHQHGNTQAALRWFERNRAASGPPGLYTEEFDVRQRQLRANLPQAFVHAALLEAATRLATPWQEHRDFTGAQVRT